MASEPRDGGEHPDLPALVPHILGTHTVLHAIKSLGKIAAVYEVRDHEDVVVPTIVEADRTAIRAMAADLLTAALRFANLEGFDLADALVERVAEKNGGANFGPIVLVDIDGRIDVHCAPGVGAGLPR